MLTLDRLLIRIDGFELRADWSVAPGEKIAIIGPSGAGKSTLLSAIAGFVSLQSGDILWSGKSIAALSPGQKPVSILFQDQNLFPHLTVAQNIGLGVRPDLRLSSVETDKVKAVIDRVGLSGFGTRKPGQLSGGQAGRAALARALLRARPVLLLDEPFSALGPALKAEMLQLVAEVAQETKATVLMVTHAPADAQLFSDRAVFVSHGLAAPPAETAGLFADPPQDLADYLGK